MTEDFILPPKLEEGDKVAIVGVGNGPSKNIFPEVYELGIKRLEEVFNLEPVEYPTSQKSMDYLANHPEQRAEELMDAFKDDEVKGVIAPIGGSGDQIRILKHLDPEVLRNNPTRFYGYSDNTSLEMYLWNQGIVSFYGPMIMTELAMQGEMHDYTVKHCKKAFFKEKIGEIKPAEKFTDETLDWGNPENLEKHREMEENKEGWIWHNTDNGVFEGRTWGGCLEVLTIQLQAEKYLPDLEELDGKILVVETSEEVPEHYWVDWCFMAMGEKGMLEKFSAIIVGRPKARHHKNREKEERQQYREQQRETIKNRVDEYAPKTPVVFNFDFGHADPIIPLPIGGKVKINTENREVEVE